MTVSIRAPIRGAGTSRWRRLAVRTAVLILVAQPLWTIPASAGVDVAREIECLAQTIYFEARGEPSIGQIAVAHVVMNRVANPLFPDRVCDVVHQGGNKLALGCQFTWWCDEISDRPTDARAWQQSLVLARRVFWDYSKDPTAGALWYHADYVEPYWRQSLAEGPKIGRHIFYRLSDKSRVQQTSLRAAAAF